MSKFRIWLKHNFAVGIFTKGWTYLVSNVDDPWESDATMFGKVLIYFMGHQITIHKIVKADDFECYHTHPAEAVRLVLWGGYVEEYDGGATKAVYPLTISRVHPTTCHRIKSLMGGPSYTLWFRGPRITETKLVGMGWLKYKGLDK